MSLDQLAAILWRRRFLFLTVAAACTAALVAVTLTLPKAYKATATLLVGPPKSTLQTTDLLDHLARTYATLAANPNVAQQVAQVSNLGLTRDELVGRISVTPVENTQLIEISAEGNSPQEAQQIANTYSNVFVADAGLRIGKDANGSKVKVIEPAVRSSQPIRPNPPLYIGLGTMLALLLGLGTALLRERLDQRVRIAPEEQSAYGHPILARLAPHPRRRAPLRHELRDRFALLKTNIDFLDENSARVIVVTSPTTGEGKSTVAANLALACVADDERVILVEADLRRPGLDETVAFRENGVRASVGLTDYLAGRAGVEDVITRPTGNENFSVIWSGPLPPNPVALLSSPKLEALLDSLAADYDRVIVDTPPISVGADASLLAARADTAIFVINEPTTTRPDTQKGLNQLENVRPAQVGIVLNRSRAAGMDGYYYYSPEKKSRLGRRARRDRNRASRVED